MRPFYVVLWLLGWRVSEVLSLTWADIRQGAVTLTAERAKGKKARGYPLDANPTLADVIESLRPGSNAIGPIFRRTGGRPLTYGQAYHHWGAACRGAGLDRIMHDCRRGSVSWHHDQGLSIKVIQSRLGWESVAMVMRYLEAWSDTAEQRVARLDGLEGILVA